MTFHSTSVVVRASAPDWEPREARGGGDGPGPSFRRRGASTDIRVEFDPHDPYFVAVVSARNLTNEAAEFSVSFDASSGAPSGGVGDYFAVDAAGAHTPDRLPRPIVSDAPVAVGPLGLVIFEFRAGPPWPRLLDVGVRVAFRVGFRSKHVTEAIDADFETIKAEADSDVGIQTR